MNRIGALGMAGALSAAVLTSCGDPQRVLESGTMGSNAQVGDVKLRNVFVEAPGGDGYRPGDDAVVRLAVVSGSARPDALLGVRTRHAAEVELRSDEDCDGTAETVPRLPAEAPAIREGVLDAVAFDPATLEGVAFVDHFYRVAVRLRRHRVHE